MDLFPLNVGTAGPPPNWGPPVVRTTGLVMGYFDGNTTTGLWNYAQYYALNDNSYGTTFGPSTPGALNVISGQTDGVIQNINSDYAVVPDGNGGYSLVSDTDPVQRCVFRKLTGADGWPKHRRSADRDWRHVGVF